jgi:hypothetical protein
MQKICEHCTAEFSTSNSRALYCCRSCSASHTQVGRPSKNRKHAASTEPPPACSQCGRVMQTYTRRYCSECIKANRAQKPKPAPRTSRTPQAAKLHSFDVTLAYKRRMHDLVKACGGRCSRCRKSFMEVSLEFDHIDRSTKVANVSAFVAASNMVGAVQEAKKCQLLCQDWHKEKTTEFSDRPNRQGSKNPMSKFSESTRRAIKAQRARGATYTALSCKYGATRQGIRYLCLH